MLKFNRTGFRMEPISEWLPVHLDGYVETLSLATRILFSKYPVSKIKRGRAYNC